MPTKKKPLIKKSPVRELIIQKHVALAWVDFVQAFWHLLDKDQRDSYLLDLCEGKTPPVITLEDMTDFEVAALRQHQGQVIQRYRKKSGMSLEELSSLIKKQKSYMSLIESGERSLTVTDMYRVMQVLDVPSTEMFKLDIALPTSDAQVVRA